MNLKSLADKIKDKDYAVKYYTEGWSKDSNENIGFLYPNSLIPSTKDINESLVQILKKCLPDSLDLMDNKETEDNSLISETRNEI